MFDQVFAQFSVIGSVFSSSWFLFLPPMFWFLFKTIWMDYANGMWNSKQNWVVLEIIPPRDIEKSPYPMESLFYGIAGEIKTPNSLEKYCDGYFDPSTSFELVGDQGRVHFYVRTQRNFQHLIESHLYAQYPGVEIVEVSDYVYDVPRLIPNKDWDLWGTDFELVDAEPVPIRTYKYFEESVTGKMIDPLAGLIEVMGRLGPGQKIWFQLVTQPKMEGWKKEAKAYIDQLVGRTKKSPGLMDQLKADLKDVFGNIGAGFSAPVEFAKKQDAPDQPIEFKLTPGEKQTLKAIEENIGKNVFSVKMRFLYLGRRETFDKSFVSAFIGGLKQFADQNLNSFKPNDISKTYPSYLFGTARLRQRQRKILNRYRSRSGEGVKCVFSTEEMATLYHMPDMTVVAPSLQYTLAKQGSPPVNLPIE